MKNSNYVVIMAGGVGSRFWPISRNDYPKQFLDILGTGKTLIQQTYSRFISLVPNENIYVITSDDYISIVKEQLPLLPSVNILGEPCRKNTAPCIAYLSFKLQAIDPDAVLVITPSDHLILNENAFEIECLKALVFVKKRNALLTLGVKPTYPNTGYGYIQREKEECDSLIYRVKKFTEKPNIDKAIEFVANGNFFWNAGIFFWKANTILQAYKLHLPETYYLFERCINDYNTSNEKAVVDLAYYESRSISIDYAIMEKVDNAYILPVSFEWSDLGTWTSAWQNMGKDDNGNALSGDSIIVTDATDCIIHAPDNKAVFVQGLQNFMIIDSEDALLICSKEKEQNIKEYSAAISQNKGQKYLYRIIRDKKNEYTKQ